MNAEIYPLRVRTACVGIATAANWLTNFLVAATFLSLQHAVSKVQTAFFGHRRPNLRRPRVSV